MMTRRNFGALVAGSLLTRVVRGAVLADATAAGPAAGGTAPQFTLPDQSGQARTLASLMGPRGLVLVFFRSADW